MSCIADDSTRDAIEAVDRLDLDAFARAVSAGANLNEVVWARCMYDCHWICDQKYRDFRARAGAIDPRPEWEQLHVSICNDGPTQSVSMVASLACAAAVDPRTEWTFPLKKMLCPDVARSVARWSLFGMNKSSGVARLVAAGLAAAGFLPANKDIDSCLTPAGVAAALCEDPRYRRYHPDTEYIATLPRLARGDLRCLRYVIASGFESSGYFKAAPTLRKWIADLAEQLGATAEAILDARVHSNIDYLSSWYEPRGADAIDVADVDAIDAAAAIVGAALSDPLVQTFAVPRPYWRSAEIAAAGVAAWHAGYLESREALGALRFCN